MAKKYISLMLYMITVVITITVSLLSVSTQADCTSSGSIRCRGIKFPTFECSPPISTSNEATLTHNSFEEGGDGGAPSACDNLFHSNSDAVVALSTGWYDGGSRCGKQILITASTGRSIVATVVDECDSRRGCDKEHAGLPPCKHNVVDGSAAVWERLGLDTDVGIVDIKWSMF